MYTKTLNIMVCPINRAILIASLILSLVFCTYPITTFAEGDASSGENQEQPKKKKGRPKKDEYVPLPAKRHMLPNFDPDHVKSGKPVEQFQNRTDLTKWLDQVIKKNSFGMVPLDPNEINHVIYIPITCNNPIFRHSYSP
jgi:hypothetical protein